MIYNTSLEDNTPVYVRSDISDLPLHHFRSVEDQQNLSARELAVNIRLACTI